jgi:hypothetical protein
MSTKKRELRRGSGRRAATVQQQMPSRKKLTSADTNTVGRSTGVGLSSPACSRQRSFSDASKEVDDARCATSAGPERTGQGFHPDSCCGRRPLRIAAPTTPPRHWPTGKNGDRTLGQALAPPFPDILAPTERLGGRPWPAAGVAAAPPELPTSGPYRDLPPWAQDRSICNLRPGARRGPPSADDEVNRLAT